MYLNYTAFHHNPRVRGSSPCAATKFIHIISDLTFRLTQFVRNTPLAQFFLAF